MTVLQPGDWPRPSGYANGVSAEGVMVFVAGQIGWNHRREIESADLVDQVRQALLNIRAVLAEAGATPKDIVRMTWYLTDAADYRARAKEIGAVFREIVGHYHSAMTAVEVTALLDDRAKVEIEVTAVIARAAR
jgi:enamine deaminase RidA (YjgF/YER057c/UK114 family)